jgi:hypothetical protein
VLLGVHKWADRLGDVGTDHKLSREALDGRQSVKEACMMFLRSGVYIFSDTFFAVLNIALASSKEREGRISALSNYFICLM